MGQGMGYEISSVKCNMMLLIRKRIKKFNAVYSLERIVLENMDSIRYLGVTISKDLKWYDQSWSMLALYGTHME